MKVVLDATVLRADFPMTGAHWETFAKGLNRVPAAELLVPEVALDEAVNGFRKDLRAAWKRLADEEHRLLGSARPDRGRELEQRTKEYRDRVIARVREMGGGFLPYPKIEHRELVGRELEGRRPFDGTGRGYRDALIWESVRELLARGVDSVVLVSNDGDFGEKTLHADLSKDLEDPQLVRLVKSLAHLNEELILPRLKMLKGVRAELESSRAGIFDLAEWLETGPLELLRDQASVLPRHVAGFPAGVGVALPASILEISYVRVLHVRDLTEHEVHVRIEVRLVAKLLLQWTAEEAHNNPAVQKFSEGPIDYAAARRDIRAEIRLVVDLVVSREDKRVESQAVHILSGKYGGISYGSRPKGTGRRPEPPTNAALGDLGTESTPASAEP